MRGNHRSNRALTRAVVSGALLMAGLFVFLLTPQPAAAEITQSQGAECRAAIAGVDVGNPAVGTISSPIVVKEHTSVSVAMSMRTPVHRRLIYLAFGGPQLQVSDETDPSSTTTTIPVDKYATYGVGYYYVTGSASSVTGDTCRFNAYIRVEGNPFTTVAGGSAAGLEVLSLLGIGAAAVGGANPGEAGTGSADPADEPIDADGLPKNPVEANTVGQAIDRTMQASMFGFCALAALPALLLTTAAMAGGAAPTGAPIRLQRVHWRPRFSLVGMASGVLGGLAAVVLLQQSGRLFPTYEILGRALVAGLLAGILIPSMTRLIAVRRANRRVATREWAIKAAVNRGATAARAAAPVPAAPPAAAPPAIWVATHRVTNAGGAVRSEPSDAAGQTSELRPGTAVRIVEERGTWARVQSADGAEGWMDSTHLERMT